MNLQKLQYLQLIGQFVFMRIIRGNELLLIMSVVLGVFGRISLLAGFAMTFQAIVAAIKPEIVITAITKALSKLGFEFNVDADFLIPLLIITLLLIYGGNWVVQYMRSYLMNCLIHRIVSDERNFLSQRVMEDDVFIIEHCSVAAQSTEKCLEIVIFISIILILFVFISPILVLILLPLLILLVVIQVHGDRAKLRELKEQNDARQRYLNRIDSSGKVQKREIPENDEYRRELSIIRERRRHRAAIKPQSDTLVGAVATVVIIYYMANVNLSSEYLVSMLIVFVIGLRNVIAAGRELSVNVSRLLELRKHIGTIKSL